MKLNSDALKMAVNLRLHGDEGSLSDAVKKCMHRTLGMACLAHKSEIKLTRALWEALRSNSVGLRV